MLNHTGSRAFTTSSQLRATRSAYQVLGTTFYFDAAGYPTRTVGLQ